MKKVWPSDEHAAMAMPKSRKRHSTRMKSNVEDGVGGRAVPLVGKPLFMAVFCTHAPSGARRDCRGGPGTRG